MLSLNAKRFRMARSEREISYNIMNAIPGRRIQLRRSHRTAKNDPAYAYQNQLPILTSQNAKVKSYRYVKLNTEKIDIDLLVQITN